MISDVVLCRMFASSSRAAAVGRKTLRAAMVLGGDVRMQKLYLRLCVLFTPFWCLHFFSIPSCFFTDGSSWVLWDYLDLAHPTWLHTITLSLSAAHSFAKISPLTVGAEKFMFVFNSHGNAIDVIQVLRCNGM